MNQHIYLLLTRAHTLFSVLQFLHNVIFVLSQDTIQDSISHLVIMFP